MKVAGIEEGSGNLQRFGHEHHGLDWLWWREGEGEGERKSLGCAIKRVQNAKKKKKKKKKKKRGGRVWIGEEWWYNGQISYFCYLVLWIDWTSFGFAKSYLSWNTGGVVIFLVCVCVCERERERRRKMKKFALLTAQNESKKDSPNRLRKVLILLKKGVDGSNQLDSMCIWRFRWDGWGMGLSLGGGCSREGACTYIFLNLIFNHWRDAWNETSLGKVRVRRETLRDLSIKINGFTVST